MDSNYIPRTRKLPKFLLVGVLFLLGIFLALSPLTQYTPEILHPDPENDPEIVTLDLKPILKNQPEAEVTDKIIYLTFDDGPGDHTDRLLDILKKYNVKATFFVTGAGRDDLLTREYNEGHAIGLHTFTHSYSYIYSSPGNFFSDLYRVQERIKEFTGYTSTLIRFPGGSSNAVSASYDGGTHIMSRLVNEVAEKGFTYFDWNVSSGDAGGATTSAEVAQNVIGALKPTASVVLQHDVKGFSVDAVEDIIKYGLENGYTFKKLDSSSFTAHHGVIN